MRFNRYKQANEFTNAVEDIKRFLKDNDDSKGKQQQKKMPLKMLAGIRKKNKERMRKDIESNREANILYNSASRTFKGITKPKMKIKVKSKKKDKKKGKQGKRIR